LALAFIDITVPPEPLYPGVGTPPLKVITPEEFEEVGSSAHRVKTDPLLTEITSSLSLGNDILALALLIATPPELIITENLIVLPDATEAELELMLSVAELALLYEKNKKQVANIIVTEYFKLYFLISFIF
jgi:hypothetical protein